MDLFAHAFLYRTIAGRASATITNDFVARDIEKIQVPVGGGATSTFRAVYILDS